MTVLRIGAVSDVHLMRNDRDEVRRFIEEVNRRADVLCVCGDMTTHGTPEQMHAFCDAVQDVECPIVAVLGNHDCHSGALDEIREILRDRGIHLLDGDTVVIGGIGFAGAKGFGGGFGDRQVDPFGEAAHKVFAAESLSEANKLWRALASLETETRVVLLHYAPIRETISGYSPESYPFFGSSRLLEPVEALGADVVFHGHAHDGPEEGATPSGVPVFNVAFPLLRKEERHCRIWTSPTKRGRAKPRHQTGGEA
jgi:Icc-related predicted phosphoesterase